MKILILAGGYGTRLYPLIKDIPKALLEVCGKSLLDHLFAKFLVLKDVQEVCVVTNDKFGDLLRAWAEGKKGLPFPLRVISDGTRIPEERLGAVGDILFVLDRETADTDWLVAGSDNLFNEGVGPFLDFARAMTPGVTVGVYDIGDLNASSKYGVIVRGPDDRIVSIEEKPAQPRSSLISMCLYYFPRQALPMIRRYVQETGAGDTTGGLIQWVYQKIQVYGFKFNGKWYDIGSLDSYHQAQSTFDTL